MGGDAFKAALKRFAEHFDAARIVRLDEIAGVHSTSLEPDGTRLTLFDMHDGGTACRVDRPDGTLGELYQVDAPRRTAASVFGAMRRSLAGAMDGESAT